MHCVENSIPINDASFFWNRKVNSALTFKSQDLSTDFWVDLYENRNKKPHLDLAMCQYRIIRLSIKQKPTRNEKISACLFLFNGIILPRKSEVTFDIKHCYRELCRIKEMRDNFTPEVLYELGVFPDSNQYILGEWQAEE